MIKKIVIFYPSKIVGGAEYLLKTTAEVLSQDFEVIIVDIEDGWLSKNVNNVKCLIINKQEKISFSNDTMLITPATCIRDLDLIFDGEFKIIAWIMQIYNIVPIFPKIGTLQFISSYRNFLKYTLLYVEYNYFNKLVDYLINTKSLYAMDDSCSDEILKVYNKKLENYLPVCIPNYKIPNNEFKTLSNQKSIRCCWLGRLDNEFKTPILNHIIKDLSNLSKEFDIHIILNIIGDGPGLELTKNIANKHKNIKVNFLLTIQGDKLKKELINSDIGFAMGTSALEIAALGIPTILLDATYSVVPVSYTYRWLYEAKDYNLGYMMESYPISKFTNRKSLKNIFQELISEYKEISIKSKNHVMQYHSEKHLKTKLITVIAETNSSFNDMKKIGLFKKPYWNFLNVILEKGKLQK